MVTRKRLHVTLRVRCPSNLLLVELAYQDTPKILRHFSLDYRGYVSSPLRSVCILTDKGAWVGVVVKALRY
jgi:hypothetical protein